MRPLHVVVYKDGRPGHEKQTASVVTAMQAFTPVVTTELSLGQTKGIGRLFQGLKAFSPFKSPSLINLSIPVDMIIGTGTATHLPMLALKQRIRAKLVTCMFPNPLLLPWFDLCLVPRHDDPPQRSNIIKTFGPPCRMSTSDRHDSRKILILAGGLDPKSHCWRTSTFLSQIRTLVLSSPNSNWTIASSPRTPDDTIIQLRKMADENPKVVFYPAEATLPGWIETAYQVHQQVWVTADSVSMVYEALTAGCQIGILPVAWKRADNKFQKGIDDLVSQGFVLTYHQWQSGEPWPGRPVALNEAQRCAREILFKWWPERLL